MFRKKGKKKKKDIYQLTNSFASTALRLEILTSIYSLLRRLPKIQGFCFVISSGPKAGDHLFLYIWVFANPYLDANPYLEPFFTVIYSIYFMYGCRQTSVLQIKYTEWNPIFSQDRSFLPLGETDFACLLLQTFLMLDFFFIFFLSP